MLDRIHNNNISDIVTKNQGLDQIDKVGVTNPIEEDRKAYFIDESKISQLALDKYQKELDVKRFGEILKNSSQKEADELVLKQAFQGLLSVDDTNTMAELISSKDFIDDIIKELS